MPSPYVKRRQRIAAQIGEHAVAIISANRLVLRNGDAHYRFRQNSDFYYLTGFTEPDAVLLIIGGQAGESILFHLPNDPQKEQWTGKRLGQQAACEVLGVQAAYPIDSLAEKLPGLLLNQTTIFYGLTTDLLSEAVVLKAVHTCKEQARKTQMAPSRLADLVPVLSEMRLLKAPEEIERMQKAADISVLAHQRAMRACAQATHEYQLEAELLSTFVSHGCHAPAYDSIVACGENACILHYTDNHAALEPGRLVLIDAAAEYDHYAADITRTFPVNGRFSGEQRALYELVLLSQRQAIASIRPGVLWESLQAGIVRVLTQGLCDLGLLTGSVDGLLEQKAYLPFYMHGSGHWLGLDVHDAGSYMQQGASRPLSPNMVLTVEPGLYISHALPNVDPRWAGIGIRIEDDVLVTETGSHLLTAALPVTIAAIEEWMADGENA